MARNSTLPSAIIHYLPRPSRRDRQSRLQRVKKFSILTAGFGEGHNAAARGIRDGLLQIAPEVSVEIRDLFAETFRLLNRWSCLAYLELINRAPQWWSHLYDVIDRQKEFRRAFRWLAPVRYRLAELIAREQPDAIVSVYPAYAHLLDELLGAAKGSTPKRVVCITDSISINAVWFRCSADAFIVANEQSAAVLERARIRRDIVRVLGFPVSPAFATLKEWRSHQPPWRILYMINAGKFAAPALVQRLARIGETELTVTVGRDDKLRRAIESIRTDVGKDFEIIGWTMELPRLLARHHLLIGKAGGATVQEAIAAKCPMIINQIVPGQEEGNAQLIAETNSGRIALSPDEVVRVVSDAISENGKLLNEWSANIAKISRPDAALEIAQFLLSS
jgi:processive 1,2-diacylglycerol beta-glucosyltransferase